MDRLWGPFDDQMAGSRVGVDEAYAELERAIETHVEQLSRQPATSKDARARIASSEADLLRQAAAIRTRFRRTLIERLPATCGADRPTPEELERYLPLDPLRIAGMRETVSVPRAALAAALASLVSGLLPAVLVGFANAELALGLALLAAALGAGAAVWITCAPLSTRVRRWLFGGAVAAGAGIVLLHVLGGFAALFATLRGPSGRKRSLIVAGALALLLTLRVWGRRISLDVADVEAAKESILAEFRSGLLADLRFLALLAAEGARRAGEPGASPALLENWRALQIEIGQAARHPERAVNADLLARCAELLGIPLEDRGRRPERFVWSGTAEQKGKYVPRGLIASGQRVRVTRRPVEERSEDGNELRVVTRGEVIPDEA